MANGSTSLLNKLQQPLTLLRSGTVFSMNSTSWLGVRVEDEAVTPLPNAPRLDNAGFTPKEKLALARQLQPAQWIDLLLFDLKDLPVFEYQVRADDFLPFEKASPGQQATALLSILLSQDGPPLIIDQPEDDLNMKIINEIVETLWQAKTLRQVIFTSHNANLVVNGDAEFIICCDYRTTATESGGQIKATGAIDVPEINREIAEVMEGVSKRSNCGTKNMVSRLYMRHCLFSLVNTLSDRESLYAGRRSCLTLDLHKVNYMLTAPRRTAAGAKGFGYFMARAEFPQSVKRIVAERSGYRCSFPGCPRTTIGPGASPREVSRTGVAAHIYSASPQGPRGQAMSPESDITDPRNAIWLCSDHARLVDNNRGSQFPAALLREYRNLHEARIAREHGGLNAPIGWFHELHIRSGPLFSTPARLQFGKTTIIAGDNETGKTALWQWAAGIGDVRHLHRWCTTYGSNEALQYEVTYFDPEERKVGVRIQGAEVHYTVEGQPVPLQPYCVRFVAPKDESAIPNWRKLDDLQRLSEMFDTPPLTIRKLLDMAPFGSRWVKSVRLVEERGKQSAAVRLKANTFDLNLGGISTSELSEVVTSIAIAFARFSARYMPTLFVLDGIMAAQLDSNSLLATVERLAAPDITFQTILIVPTRQIDHELLTLHGGTMVWLEGKKPNVTIGRLPPTPAP